MKFIQQEIEGVWVIEPEVHGDSRGYFMESWRADLFERHVGKVEFVQDNESLSSRRGVLRGLHFQAGSSAQAKLVRVTEGAILDVVVDLRKGSKTFGRHVMVELSQANHRQLYMPRGMAHGFVVMSDRAQFQYKVDNYYDPTSERTLLYNDPALGIEWPLSGDELLLSEKDLKGSLLAELDL